MNGSPTELHNKGADTLSFNFVRTIGTNNSLADRVLIALVHPPISPLVKNFQGSGRSHRNIYMNLCCAVQKSIAHPSKRIMQCKRRTLLDCLFEVPYVVMGRAARVVAILQRMNDQRKCHAIEDVASWYA